ncbi:MAG TPA: pitrilysin family protein [Ignavibacteriaceae bacterium]|nr:pitrilysin family protein [Ignavibacteriaceae bacterium]
MNFSKAFSVLLLSVFAFIGFKGNDKTFKIEYEKYKLDNGLEVILHRDKSDPIISVAIQYHVGSNREIKGRTGFAHLFEHIMFQESQHVGQDQFFKIIQGNGGTLNGGTWFDGTVYFEVMPKNYLETVLWLESDRMGWLLPTVTQDAFENQQEVVQNEKRQRVDNQPYGNTNYIINKLLYPEDHPYNWQVIGSMEDLQNATVQDVRDFYSKWYGPNNATLVIAGDFDADKTKELVKKYFGEIQPSPPVVDPKPIPVTLNETKRAYYEDNFAKSPELRMVFPTVEQYSKDSYALDILSNILADGKKAPLYKVIVEDKMLAPSADAYQSSQEIAGTFDIRVRAFPDKNLSDVEDAILEAFKKFEKDGFTDEDLSRIKATTETNFYNSISSILGKSFQLASYNEYAGSPDFINDDLQNSLNVTKDDIWRVYNKYIKGKKYVLTSFVPKGKADLAAKNSGLFVIPEEKIVPKEDKEKNIASTVKPLDEIPGSFDRNIQPVPGPDPEVKIPAIWEDTPGKGLKLYGIEQKELPLVQFSITLKGGMLLDSPEKTGTANLLSDLMMEGTKNKTPLELEEAIENLGADINIRASKEEIVMQVNTLASKFDEVYKLAEEIILEPRWDEKEFNRIKQETIETINRNKSNPARISGNVFDKLIYGKNSPLGNSTLGTVESVSSVTIDDLKKYYENNFAPSAAWISIVGDISKDKAVSAFSSLADKWQDKKINMPEISIPQEPSKPIVYFVDVPGAKQSEIRIGKLSLRYTDPDYYAATVMNYKLGGSFNGIVNLILREEKGYTYGARTEISGSDYPGTFEASSAVQSNATFESVKIFRDEIAKYRDGISEDDLKFTKDALIKSNARRFETLGALLGMLNDIAEYNLPFDYIKNQEEVIKNMTPEEHKALGQKYLQQDKMIYVIVGDAATQLEKLKDLGLGDPVLIDADGNKENL